MAANPHESVGVKWRISCLLAYFYTIEVTLRISYFSCLIQEAVRKHAEII